MAPTSTSARFLHRTLLRRFLAAACIALCMLRSAAAEIVVIDTKGGGPSKEFVEQFMEACSACGQIVYKDGEGDPKRLKEVSKNTVTKSDSIVVAVGSPAANAVLEASGSVRLVATLAPNIKNSGKNGHIHILPSSLSSQNIFDLSLALVGQNTKIAFIGGETALDAFKASVSGCAKKCLFFSVSKPSALPDIVGRAYASADFIVFLKDASVINRHSADFIIKQAIANNKPTLSFSKALAERGLTFAVTPDVSVQAALAAKVVLNMQSGQSPAIAEGSNAFRLHVNCRVLKRTTTLQRDIISDDLCEKKTLSFGSENLISVEPS